MYTEKLNGYWEEGYHYYLEFRDDQLTVRRYDRVIVLQTEIAYDADAIENGKRTVIELKDKVLSRSLTGEMMTEIGELAWENDTLSFLYHYPSFKDTVYTLHKVDHGPFAHIIVRDEEYMDSLQGVWVQWGTSRRSQLVIKGNTLSWDIWGGGPFHVISYTYAPDRVLLTPEDLTKDNFSGFTQVQVKPDMLCTTLMVSDMSMPLTVFAREKMLDQIEVPDAAKAAPVSTMMNPNPNPAMPMGMFGLPPQDTQPKQEFPEGCCPNCGYKIEEDLKFCPNCGTQLKD